MFKPISRRTLLRGAGAALGLPWLEVMSHASPSTDPLRLSEPPLRAAFLFWSNGVRPDHWTPAGDGEDYEFTPHLKPLESLKSDILLLENLWHKNTTGRNGHWPKDPAWLSGGYVERTTGRDLDSGGTSVDQLAAQHIGTQDCAAEFRTRHRRSAHGHRYGRRRIPAHVRIVYFLERSAHSGAEGDHPAACFRPAVPECGQRLGINT